MNLSEFTLENLKVIVTGDSDITPHMKGKDIVALFNKYGERDIYSKVLGGNKSRKEYTLKKLNKLNKTRYMKDLLEDIVKKDRYKGTDLEVELVVDNINKLINYDGYKMELINDSYVVIGCEQYKEEVEIEVHFEDIQKQIIECIRSAKYLIWVAVAWFTDNEIVTELLKKKDEGINIQLVIMDDEINRQSGIDFDKNFETYKVKKSGFCKNIMHTKFCIIDLNTVVHGSYNWTKKAQYNKEEITVDKSRELAENYASRFIKLKKDSNNK